MGFDNYCKAVLGGATHVVRCTLEYWPDVTYQELFEDKMRWFTDEHEAQLVAAELNDSPPGNALDLRPAGAYWVEEFDHQGLN